MVRCLKNLTFTEVMDYESNLTKKDDSICDGGIGRIVSLHVYGSFICLCFSLNLLSCNTDDFTAQYRSVKLNELNIDTKSRINYGEYVELIGELLNILAGIS